VCASASAARPDEFVSKLFLFASSVNNNPLRSIWTNPFDENFSWEKYLIWETKSWHSIASKRISFKMDNVLFGFSASEITILIDSVFQCIILNCLLLAQFVSRFFQTNENITINY
jgi:hypothetical protein